MAMPKDDWIARLDRTVARYEKSIRAGRSGARADGDTAAQAERYRDAAARRQMRTAQIRELLDRADVPAMWLVPYANFAQHIDRVCRKYGSATRQVLIEAAIEHWTAHGLDTEVLRLIIDETVDPDDETGSV